MPSINEGAFIIWMFCRAMCTPMRMFFMLGLL